jgi:hypothetical protein
MSKKKIFNYCCFILAVIPLLGMYLALFGSDDLLKFCIAPTCYGKHYSGDGGLAVVAEAMITIPLEIILCIYSLVVIIKKIIHKKKDVNVDKTNKK